MKIAFIISNLDSQSKGNGGHYHSLITTVSAVSKHHNVTIFNIGSQKSLAFRDIEVIDIIDKNLHTFKLLKELYLFLKNHPHDILHVFDEFAFFYTRVVNVLLHKPIVLTKCGGGNPKYFYPKSKNLIVYSRENQKYFESKNKFKRSNILLIPNRIIDFEDDEERILKLKQKYKLQNYDYIFLRISRIGNSYRNSLFQLVELVNEIRNHNINVCLLVIGMIEDKSLKNEIDALNYANIFIETDEQFTKDAKAVISVSDVVLGTGRSFMEASLKNKIMLAPISDGNSIVMVDKNNFQKLFDTNFSERGVINKFDKKGEIDKLITVLQDQVFKNKLLSDTKRMYQESFNIDYSINQYNILYNSVKFVMSFSFIDTAFNYIFVKLLFRANRKAKKIGN